MFLFIVSVGLSVTMGLMGFVNLAHGVFAMAGGYLVLTADERAWGVPFFLALLAHLRRSSAPPACCSSACSTRRLYKATELDQVLLTIGLVFMAVAAYTYFYGPLPQTIQLPDYLTGQIDRGFRTFPTYRVFVIAVGAGADRGAVVRLRAHQFRREDPRRGRQPAHGAVDRHQRRRLFTLTFALGSGLAALGGGLGIQLFGLDPELRVALPRVLPDRGRGRRARQLQGHVRRRAPARRLRHRLQILYAERRRLLHLRGRRSLILLSSRRGCMAATEARPRPPRTRRPDARAQAVAFMAAPPPLPRRRGAALAARDRRLFRCFPTACRSAARS